MYGTRSGNVEVDGNACPPHSAPAPRKHQPRQPGPLSPEASRGGMTSLGSNSSQCLYSFFSTVNTFYVDKGFLFVLRFVTSESHDIGHWNTQN